MARKALGSAPSDPKDTATKGYVDTEDTASRDRTNHTGTQTASTISDFDTEVSNNVDVTANTAKVSYTDSAKVAGIEAGADVTDTINVAAAGAVMDSEVTNLTQVKAFDTTDYATAAQGSLADTATQPADISDFETTTELNARDTANRARANHTGTQTMSTISDAGTLATQDTATSSQLYASSAFEATMTSSQTSGAGATITVDFDTTTYDIGSDFNTANNYFVAPYDGIYNFQASVNQPDSGTPQVLVMLSINSGTSFKVLFRGDMSIYRTNGGAADLKLDASDTVEVEFSSLLADTIETSESWFSGHLVARV